MIYDIDSEGFPDDSENQKLPLHFFWILDHSHSMEGQRISELNAAIREVLPEIRKVADDNPSVDVLMRAIAFSSNVNWHIGSDPVKLADFSWIDLGGGCSKFCVRNSQGNMLLQSALKMNRKLRQCEVPVLHGVCPAL